MSKIEMNKSVFDATITQLQEANSQLNATTFQPNISKTTLKSIEQQLKTFKELEKALNDYQALLELDVHVLMDTGQKLVERDTEISSYLKKV